MDKDKIIQQLKAEIEELKKRISYWQNAYSKVYQVVENKGYIKELDQLKAEIEKLKKEKEDYCSICDVADRLRKFVWYATDGRMSYANYTYEAMCNVYDEVLENHIKPYQKEIDELTEKNERLKEEMKVYGATGICEICTEKANLESDKLKLENKKLKIELEAYKQSEQEGLEIIAELKNKKYNYYLLTLEYERANNNFINCLIAIKNIASTKCPLLPDEECAKNKRYGCEECYSKAILDKISEVIK